LNNIKNKISKNKILTFIVVAFVLALSLYGCKTFIANAANNQETESTENQGQVDVNNEQAVNDEAPLEAYGYKDTTSEPGQTILVLTYDKDKEEHRDAGQKVYCLPTAATECHDWQWYRDSSITKIKIALCFKDYTGLNSTAWMFAHLDNVSSLEGFENINVSNVTDTSHMFWRCGNEHSFECLDLSSWDTSNIQKCTFMLSDLKLSSIKVGPKFDLSFGVEGCDLTNSKGKCSIFSHWYDFDGNMYRGADLPQIRGDVATYYDHQILCAYGYKDADKLILTYDREMYNHKNQGQEVFDLAEEKWQSPCAWYHNRNEITEVTIKKDFENFHGLTSTAYMFEDLFYVNKVEGFQYIDTSNVTSMNAMFMNFGCRSTSLNTAPVVSGWDTSNVTDMSWMFYHYGGDSDALDNTPYVFRWNTAKVTKTTSMFQDYGKGSFKNIDFSNWDTSNITDRADYDNMLDMLKVESITLGPKWDLAMYGFTHWPIKLENTTWLTDETGGYASDFYDSNGKPAYVEAGGCCYKVVDRTEPTTYYPSCVPRALESQDSINKKENVNIQNFDLKFNQQNAIDNAISQHSQNSSLIHHITHHVSKVADVVKKVFH
jgi:surface protein